MSKEISKIKMILENLIQKLSEDPGSFVKNPGKDFTRNRKLSFKQVITTLICMEGGSLTSELMKRFGCRQDIVSVSAFVQQREKVRPEAFQWLFDSFVAVTSNAPVYHGYRLWAVDGSDIQIPTNPQDRDSYFPGTEGQKSYNLLHLNAIYDLLQNTYVDTVVQKRRDWNERRALIQMLDHAKSNTPVIIIADRGYESYNNMAHIHEKGWKYLIRIKDHTSSNGIAKGLDLPEAEEFDLMINLSLTRRQTNEIRELCKDKNHFKWLPNNVVFDFLPPLSQGYPSVFFDLSFRIVRFKLSENVFETVVTNLESKSFPPTELKKLYALRWGVETSFRELKYLVGLIHFHSKKEEHILQEIFARFIMYNFASLITRSVIIERKNRKFAYKANFSVAIHVCRMFFLGNVSPPDLEAIIARFVSPIRPGRTNPRRASRKMTISFNYRIS